MLHTEPYLQFAAAASDAENRGRIADAAIRSANESIALNATLRRQAEARLQAADAALERVRVEASMEIGGIQGALDASIMDLQELQDSEVATQRQITQLSGEFVAQSINLEESKEATKRQIKANNTQRERFKKTQAMLTRQMSAAQNERFAARRVAQDYMNALERAERALERTNKAMGLKDRRIQEAWDADVMRRKNAMALPPLPKKKKRWTNSTSQTL